MTKKMLLVAILLCFVFQGSAFADVETAGDVVFRDALYGAVIGGLIGGAIYLVDDKDPGAKIGIGLAIGTIGGLFFGIVETRSMVEIEKDKIKFALPTPVIQKSGDSVTYSTSLLKVDF